MSTQITLQTTPEFSHLDSSKTHQILSLLTINAPPSSQESTRAPLDLVAVLDISGSMRGDKLNMVKKTMCFAIKQLQSKDRLGIVLFESSVSVLFPMTQMTGDNKQHATNLVEEVVDKGSTDLAGGLSKAYDLLVVAVDAEGKREQTNEDGSKVTSILLFTDGEANVGLRTSPEIVALMKSKQETLGKTCSVFSFGFGKDHSVELLRNIAEAGSGMYYFVEDEDKIASAFGDCIGGLLSVSAQNLELSLQTDERVKIKKVFGLSQTKGDVGVESHKYQTELGDIYHEEERNILILLEVSPSLENKVHEQVICECKLKGFDVMKADVFEVSETVKLMRDSESKKDTEKTSKIEVQRNRIQTIEAIEQGRTLAKQNNFEEARKVLNEAIRKLKESSQSDSVITRQLIGDLEESLQDMKDTRDFHQFGEKKMAMCSRSHQAERAVHSKPMYSNASKSRAKEDFAKNIQK